MTTTTTNIERLSAFFNQKPIRYINDVLDDHIAATVRVLQHVERKLPVSGSWCLKLAITVVMVFGTWYVNGFGLLDMEEVETILNSPPGTYGD